jgi:hypothetical protein
MTTKNVALDPAQREALALVLGFKRAGCTGFYVDRAFDERDAERDRFRHEAELAAEPSYAPKRRRAIVNALADLLMADLDRSPA